MLLLENPFPEIALFINLPLQHILVLSGNDAENENDK